MNQIISFFDYLINSPEIIALIVGGLSAFLFGLWGGLSKEKRTPKWIIWGISVSGLIVSLAGIYSGFEGQKTSKLLQSKTEEIVKLSEKNMGFLTGGDSYIYLVPFIPVHSDMIQFYIMHSGEYPMYDVSINIRDLTLTKNLDYEGFYNKYTNKTKNGLNFNVDPLELIKQFDILSRKAVIAIDLGNVSPKTMNKIGPYKITGIDSDDKTQLYSVQIVARNGNRGISQSIKAVKIDGNWKYSWKVTSNDGEVLIERKVTEVPLD